MSLMVIVLEGDVECGECPYWHLQAISDEFSMSPRIGALAVLLPCHRIREGCRSLHHLCSCGHWACARSYKVRGLGLHDELVFDLAEVKLKIVAYQLLPTVLEIEEDVLPDILLSISCFSCGC